MFHILYALVGDTLNYEMCPEYLRLIKIFVFSGVLDNEISESFHYKSSGVNYIRVGTSFVQIVHMNILYK